MKKWILVVAAVVLTISLAACNKEVDLGEKGEVYHKVMENTEKLESVHTNIFIDQLIKEEGAREDMQMRTGSEVSLVRKPFGMHMIFEIDSGLGEEEALKEESYITEDGAYVRNNDTKWEHNDLPPEALELLSKGNVNTTIDLSFFEQFLERFNFSEEDNNTYLFSLVMHGDKKDEREVMDQIIVANLKGQVDSEETNLKDIIEPEYVRVEIFVDQETLQMTHYNLDMKVELVSSDAPKMHITQHTEGQLSEFNAIDEVVVPEEVKKEAEEMSMKEESEEETEREEE